MRAAHSLKGAARIIGLQDGVDIAHVMEECFVGAQRGELQLTPAHIDVLLRGVDLLMRVGDAKPDAPVTRADIDGFVKRMLSPESAARETADGDGANIEPDVDVYAQLQAQLQALHRRQFKARRATVPEAATETGAHGQKKKKRGAPAGHPPWQRPRPGRIDPMELAALQRLMSRARAM